MRYLALLVTVFATAAQAEPYKRPIPQAQSATAEFWFFVATIMLLASLYAVHWVITRR